MPPSPELRPVPTPETIYDEHVPSPLPDAAALEEDRLQRLFALQVFAWMFGGLLLTAFVSLTLTRHTDWYAFGVHQALFRITFAVEFVLAAWLRRHVANLDTMTAISVFVAYAALNGFAFAVFLPVFSPRAIATAFLVSAALFACMLGIGYFLDLDLLAGRSLLVMAALGAFVIAVAGIAGDTPVTGAVSLALLAFVGLTVHHAGDIRDFGEYTFEGDDAERKAAVLGALLLYLDLVIIFIVALGWLSSRFSGSRLREEDE